MGEVSIWVGAGRTAERELKKRVCAWLVREKKKTDKIGLGPNFYRVKEYGRPTCKEETAEILCARKIG